MKQNYINRLQHLTQLPAVSSDEYLVSRFLKQQYGQFTQTIVSDHLGSVFGVKEADTGVTLMLASNMDELGLMVTEIRPDGTLSFLSLAEYSPVSICHQRVQVYSRTHKATKGIIVSHHKRWMEETVTQITLEELVIDCGFETREQALKTISIGDFAIIDGAFEQFNEATIVAKALNNRIGLELGLQIFEALKDESLEYTLAIGGIVQSHVGWRGAMTSTYAIQPDMAIVLDCSEVANSVQHIQCHHGLVIRHYDKQLLPSKEILHDFKDHCVANHIPHQDYTNLLGNDGSFIHKTRSGTPTISLGIPAKNLGSQSVMLSTMDCDHLVLALVSYLKQLTKEDILTFQNKRYANDNL